MVLYFFKTRCNACLIEAYSVACQHDQLTLAICILIWSLVYTGTAEAGEQMSVAKVKALEQAHRRSGMTSRAYLIRCKIVVTLL